MTPESQSKPNFKTILIILIFIILTGLVTYLLLENNKKAEAVTALKIKEQQLEQSLEETTKEKKELEATVTELSKMLSLTKEDLEDIEDDLRDEKDKNEEFEDQLRDLSGTVKNLDKLSKTDEELLEKYSRTYFLNENYVPQKLEEIDDDYILQGRKDQYFHHQAIEFLEDMLDEAEDDGHDIKIVSAYRSFDEQNELKGHHTQVYGSGANTFSADQGYSEHQLGTTVDLTDETTGGAYQSFAETEAYEWLLDNAHRFGFILSYPEGNAFYIFEPWHWRFVGVDLARDLHKRDDQFYEWDQRRIDKYLIDIFD